MIKTGLGALVASLVLMGCVATAYHPLAFTGGYKDTKVADDRYKVHCEANGWTSEETARTYLMYRCAELTLSLGYDSFVAQDLTMAHTGIALAGWPETDVEIVMFKGKDTPNAIIAADVIKELEPKIRR
jgi:hypothetical protein